ncbi:hypothetical protein M5689_006931 [Euphorbia peplus]|nr:hypothetical protein M5689_006931 [Euphorbia peplus]
MEMEDYLEFICFYYIAKNTDTGFKCKFCSYEGCDRATVMNHIKHVTRAECRGVEIVESTRPLVQNFYDKPPIEASDVQELNDATDRPNIKYALRSRTCIQKKTTGDHSVPTSHQGPSSSNYAVRSRIEKKKTGVSNISTHLSPSSSSKYALTSPMQFKLDMQQTLDLQKKLDIFTKVLIISTVIY